MRYEPKVLVIKGINIKQESKPHLQTGKKILEHVTYKDPTP